MKARDLMSAEVISVLVSTPVGEVAHLMLDKHLSGVPVLDESGKLVGMVTGRDLVAKHANPLVVERIPFAVRVGLLQGEQLFIQADVLVHHIQDEQFCA